MRIRRLAQEHLQHLDAIVLVAGPITERGERLVSDRLDGFIHGKHAGLLAALWLG